MGMKKGEGTKGNLKFKIGNVEAAAWGDFLDYCAWVVTEFWRGYSAFPLLAFGLTLGLQFARRRMGGRQYRLLWGVLAVVGSVWGVGVRAQLYAMVRCV